MLVQPGAGGPFVGMGLLQLIKRHFERLAYIIALLVRHKRAHPGELCSEGGDLSRSVRSNRWRIAAR